MVMKVREKEERKRQEEEETQGRNGTLII